VEQYTQVRTKRRAKKLLCPLHSSERYLGVTVYLDAFSMPDGTTTSQMLPRIFSHERNCTLPRWSDDTQLAHSGKHLALLSRRRERATQCCNRELSVVQIINLRLGCALFRIALQASPWTLLLYVGTPVWQGILSTYTGATNLSLAIFEKPRAEVGTLYEDAD
jgi:hypothetical protein